MSITWAFYHDVGNLSSKSEDDEFVKVVFNVGGDASEIIDMTKHLIFNYNDGSEIDDNTNGGILLHNNVVKYHKANDRIDSIANGASQQQEHTH